MTKVSLLEALKARIALSTGELIMPTKMQKGDEEQSYRAPEVFLVRLPDTSSAVKRAPYVLLQPVNGSSKQLPNEPIDCTSTIRIMCCTYNEDAQEGGLMLLNLMERVRVDLLTNPIVGNQFELCLFENGGLEDLVYPDDTAPFFLGEIIATFTLPPIKREVMPNWT